MTKINPDDYYDRRVDAIIEAQRTCPYLQVNEPINDLNDHKICLVDMKGCERRRHCPNGKW